MIAWKQHVLVLAQTVLTRIGLSLLLELGADDSDGVVFDRRVEGTPIDIGSDKFGVVGFPTAAAR